MLINLSINRVLNMVPTLIYITTTLACNGLSLTHVITSNSALTKWRRNIEKLRLVSLSGKLTILMKVPIKLTTRDSINIQVLAMYIEQSLTISPILLNRVTVSSTTPIQVVSAEKRI